MDFMKLKRLLILTKARVIDILALEAEYRKAIKSLEEELKDDNTKE